MFYRWGNGNLEVVKAFLSLPGNIKTRNDSQWVIKPRVFIKLALGNDSDDDDDDNDNDIRIPF